jgi:hypothetical protein
MVDIHIHIYIYIYIYTYIHIYIYIYIVMQMAWITTEGWMVYTSDQKMVLNIDLVTRQTQKPRPCPGCGFPLWNCHVPLQLKMEHRGINKKKGLITSQSYMPRKKWSCWLVHRFPNLDPFMTKKSLPTKQANCVRADFPSQESNVFFSWHCHVWSIPSPWYSTPPETMVE